MASYAATPARPTAAASGVLTAFGTSATDDAAVVTYSAIEPDPSAGDPIPYLDAVRAVPHTIDRADEVTTEHDGEAMRHRVPQLAGSNGKIEPVHRCGIDSDAEDAALEAWLRNFDDGRSLALARDR
jgi:hypothetical protein